MALRPHGPWRTCEGLLQDRKDTGVPPMTWLRGSRRRYQAPATTEEQWRPGVAAFFVVWSLACWVKQCLPITRCLEVAGPPGTGLLGAMCPPSPLSPACCRDIGLGPGLFKILLTAMAMGARRVSCHGKREPDKTAQSSARSLACFRKVEVVGTLALRVIGPAPSAAGLPALHQGTPPESYRFPGCLQTRQKGKRIGGERSLAELDVKRSIGEGTVWWQKECLIKNRVFRDHPRIHRFSGPEKGQLAFAHFKEIAPRIHRFYACRS